MIALIRRIVSFYRYKYNNFKIRKYYLKKLKEIENPIFIDGHPDSKNFGDGLNMFIINYISQKNVFPSKFLRDKKYKNSASYSAIGSICQWSRKESVVWGSGFISDIYVSEPFITPLLVCAVRGPLSRNIYLQNKIECPEIYGDPALLLPLIYNPQVSTTYEFGIIPHYTEIENDWVKTQGNNPDNLIINILVGSDYENFVRQIKSCKRIIASSLHGLILAQAYNIPVCWIKISNGLTGGDFKFKDYLMSVNKKIVSPTNIIEKEYKISELTFDYEPLKFNIEPLIESCPFIHPDKKKELLKKSSYYENIASNNLT